MLTNLLFGFSTMLLCLFLQIYLLVGTIGYYMHHRFGVKQTGMLAHLLTFSIVMIMLLIGNMAQISLWAWLFMYLDEFKNFHTAFYHSMVNFGSLGYGDIVMSEKHRLLGAFEAINGVLMIGISTAALSTPFKDLLKARITVKD